MDKQTLKSYCDALEIIKETEQKIKELNSKKSEYVQDAVSGSKADFPYTRTLYSIEGKITSAATEELLKRKQRVLEQQKAEAEAIKTQIEEFKLSCPLRIRRIIEYKYIECLSWQQVAKRFGKSCTSDSLRSELDRFLKKCQG